MIFADALRGVNDRLTSHERQASSINLQEEYAKLREFLAARLEAAQECEGRLKILQLAGFKLAELQEHARQLAETTADLLAICSRNPERLEKQGESWQLLLDEDHALNENLLSIYGGFRDSLRLSSIPGAYAILSRLPSGPFRETYERLRRINSDLSLLLPEEFPASGSAIASARSLQEEADRLVAELEQSVPESVIAFLNWAARGNAHLNDLTPEVLAWLKEHGLAPSIRLTI